MKRIVIDTNVLISALLFGGIPGELVPLWKNRHIQPLASRVVVEEYLRVLVYPKFSLSEKEIDFLLSQEILPWFEIVAIGPGRPIVAGDPSDHKSIWCALAGKAEAIISGDEHLLNLADCEIPVLSHYKDSW